MQIKAIVILGPTSSGKSEVAFKLAKKFKGEVISADSRQVYRGMDLGTGKVPGKWMLAPDKKLFIYKGVPHHLIDFRSPRGEYNVAHFQKDCSSLIEKISKRGKIPIICGGTGFWIDAAVFETKLPKVAPDKKLRIRLDKKTPEQLFEILKKLDSKRAKTIDGKNKFRLIRAIEICKKLGSVPKVNSNPPAGGQNSKFILIGLDWPQEILDQKIKKRLFSRWKAGMIKEVLNLRKKYGLSWKKIQSFGLGYFWIPLFLQKKISEQELKEKVFIAERRYAKRQRAWFKRNKNIIWEKDCRKIEKLVSSFLSDN